MYKKKTPSGHDIAFALKNSLSPWLSAQDVHMITLPFHYGWGRGPMKSYRLMREYWQLMVVGEMHVTPASGNYLPPMLSHEALIKLSRSHGKRRHEIKSRNGQEKRFQWEREEDERGKLGVKITEIPCINIWNC